MKQFVKKNFTRAFPSLWLTRSLLFGEDSYLTTTGWRESCRLGRPVRPDGSELPWMNYAIISFLETRLTKKMSLFEFGSGFSTIFYSRLVRDVTSIEYDRKWFDLITEKVPEHVDVRFVDKDVDGDYCRSIHSSDIRFDVVIVDGRDRVNCVKQSIDRLNEGGVIILDDSNRERYAATFDIAEAKGFKSLDFEGLKPTGISLDQSTLFYRPDNCLNL